MKVCVRDVVYIQMRPRKRYLDAGGDVTDLPYTTRKRLFEIPSVSHAVDTATQQATVQDRACSVPLATCNPADLESDEDSDVPSASPPREESGLSSCGVLPPYNEPTLQPEPAEEEEPTLSPDDLLALAVNFAIEYALP